VTLAVGQRDQDHRRQQHQRGGEDNSQRVHLHRHSACQHKPHDRRNDGHQRTGDEASHQDLPDLQVLHLAQHEPCQDGERDQDKSDRRYTHASGLNVVLLPVARPRPEQPADGLFDVVAPHRFSPPRKVLHKYTRKASL